MSDRKDKELQRLERLMEETAKQRMRCVALLQQDVRLLGVATFARHMGCRVEYLYRIYDGRSISFKQLKRFWDEAESLAEKLRLKE